jgi:hypothetical protein
MVEKRVAMFYYAWEDLDYREPYIYIYENVCVCVRVENGARIADAKLNPITGRTLNNYKYTGQFITVERVPCSLPCARRLKILFFTYLFSYIRNMYIYIYIYIYIIYACECIHFSI